MAMNITSDLTFDEEQKVHILPKKEQDEAQQIVAASGEYRRTLEEFNATSSAVIAQIDELAQHTEKRRKRALALKALNAAAAQSVEYLGAVGRCRLSARVFELECVRAEVDGYENYQ